MNSVSNPTRQAMIEAVQAEFDRIAPAVRLEAKERGDPAFSVPELVNIQIAQNVLRDCMTAVLQRLTPFSHVTPAELALRLGAYALSALPEGDQDQAAATVASLLPRTLRRRRELGVTIQTAWEG